MTDKTTAARGYDDSRHLKEMADGIIVRRYASVDEAAKSVLGEESGSNVDRLRRKFREQNWYERGLGDYVDAEINRRNAEADTAVADVETVTPSGRKKAELELVLERAWLKVAAQLRPTLTLGLIGCLATTAMAAVIMRATTDGVGLMTMLFLVNFAGMCLWSTKAPKGAGMVRMAGHLATLFVFFAGLVLFSWLVVPDPSFFCGSLLGDGVLWCGGIIISIYLNVALFDHAKKVGRPNATEFAALAIAASIVFNVGGLLPVLIDLKSHVNRAEAGEVTYQKLTGTIEELKASNPNADLKSLLKARREILLQSLSMPDWTK